MILFNAPKYAMLAKHYSKSQQVTWSHIIIVLIYLYLLPDFVDSFEKQIEKITTGEPYPHILKKDTFTLNTRNIKVIRAGKKYLWIGTSNGLIRYDTEEEEQIEVYDNKHQLLSNGIFAISLDKNGWPWIGTYGGGLSYFNGSNWKNYNTPDGLNDAFVYDIAWDKEKIWLATWSGVNFSTINQDIAKTWASFTVKNSDGGLIDDWVYAVEVEKSGRIWFGTESGISTYYKGKWKGLNNTNGLGASYNLVKEKNREIMSLFKGQHHNASPSIPNIQTADYKPNYIVSMLLDEKNRLWIGTWGGGLSLLDTKTFKFRNFTTQDGLPGNFILSIEEDHSGGLWIGTNDGLSLFDGKKFLNFSRINGLKSKFIFSLEAAQDHSLWVGGHQTLTRIIIDPTSGFPLNLQ